MIPPGDSSELSPGNNYPTEVIIIDWFQKTLYTQVKIATSSFYFVLPQLQIKRARVSLELLHIFYFLHKLLYLFFKPFSIQLS